MPTLVPLSYNGLGDQATVTGAYNFATDATANYNFAGLQFTGCLWTVVLRSIRNFPTSPTQLPRTALITGVSQENADQPILIYLPRSSQLVTFTPTYYGDNNLSTSSASVPLIMTDASDPIYIGASVASGVNNIPLQVYLTLTRNDYGMAKLF